MLYSIISPNGNVLGQLSEAKTKRVLSEIYRDIFRSRLKGTTENFLKHYQYLTWDEKRHKATQTAFYQTKRPSIDHNFPIDFWFHYYEGKYIDCCSHPDNVFIISKIKNTSKGSKMPCPEMNNQMIITLANFIKVEVDDLKQAMELFSKDKKKFKKMYSFDACVKNVITNLSRDEIRNSNIDEICSYA